MQLPDKQTVDDALYRSIEKWQRNAFCTDIEETLTGQGHCPLCALFLGSDCKGCPVAMETGQILCRGTSYNRAYDVKIEVREGKALIGEFSRHAQNYTDFLDRIWRKR